jgi:hypothetical protein
MKYNKNFHEEDYEFNPELDEDSRLGFFLTLIVFEAIIIGIGFSMI